MKINFYFSSFYHICHTDSFLVVITNQYSHTSKYKILPFPLFGIFQVILIQMTNIDGILHMNKQISFDYSTIQYSLFIDVCTKFIFKSLFNLILALKISIFSSRKNELLSAMTSCLHS
jgi:bacteriorhodopsin